MGAIFSQQYHDNGGKKKKRRKAAVDAPLHVKPNFPSGSFQTLLPTDEERKALRAKQLRKAVRDPDLEGYHRREYHHQDGSTTYSEPRALPPRYDVRKPRVLETDVDLKSDVYTPQQLQQRTVSEKGRLQEEGSQDNITASLGRIADISVNDLGLNKLDQKITDGFSVIRNLKEAADNWLRMAEKEGTDAQIHHSEQIAWIIKEAIIPWLNEVDQHFNGILEEMTAPGEIQ